MDLTLVKTNVKFRAQTKTSQTQANLQIFVEFHNRTLLNSDLLKAYLINRK